MKILILDNYDSFTYNLVHLVDKLTSEPVEVYRNDKIPIDEISAYDKIILSPGPGLPKDAGIMPEVIQTYAKEKPILGVCLGHQAIGEAFGGKLINLKEVYHGVATPIQIIERAENKDIFQNLPNEILAGRYHSWIIADEDFPDDLIVTSRDLNGQIMSIRHKTYPCFGVQFHPESVLTPEGETILKNWIAL
jgi:anthranilate synthase component 2